MTEVERTPRFSLVAAIGAATVAFLLSLPGGAASAAFALVGLPLLAYGVVVGRRWFVSVGAVVLFGSVVVAGMTTAVSSPVLVLFAGATVVVAWDVGTNGIDLAEQVGATARTRRAEVAHLVGSAAAGLVTVAAGYGTYLFAWGGQSVAGLVLLLFGAVLLVAAALQ